MERQIGERFNWGEVTLEVEEAPNGHPCGNCYFMLNDWCFKFANITGKCSGEFRTDKREIIFKEV